MPAVKPKILGFHPENARDARNAERPVQGAFKTRTAAEIRPSGSSKDGVYELPVCTNAACALTSVPSAPWKEIDGRRHPEQTAASAARLDGFCPTGDMRRASISITRSKCIAADVRHSACPEKA
jgi:hypothetical protein